MADLEGLGNLERDGSATDRLELHRPVLEGDSRVGGAWGERRGERGDRCRSESLDDLTGGAVDQRATAVVDEEQSIAVRIERGGLGVEAADGRGVLAAPDAHDPRPGRDDARPVRADLDPLDRPLAHDIQLAEQRRGGAGPDADRAVLVARGEAFAPRREGDRTHRARVAEQVAIRAQRLRARDREPTRAASRHQELTVGTERQTLDGRPRVDREGLHHDPVHRPVGQLPQLERSVLETDGGTRPGGLEGDGPWLALDGVLGEHLAVGQPVEAEPVAGPDQDAPPVGADGEHRQAPPHDALPALAAIERHEGQARELTPVLPLAVSRRHHAGGAGDGGVHGARAPYGRALEQAALRIPHVELAAADGRHAQARAAGVRQRQERHEGAIPRRRCVEDELLGLAGRDPRPGGSIGGRGVERAPGRVERDPGDGGLVRGPARDRRVESQGEVRPLPVPQVVRTVLEPLARLGVRLGLEAPGGRAHVGDVALGTAFLGRLRDGLDQARAVGDEDEREHEQHRGCEPRERQRPVALHPLLRLHDRPGAVGPHDASTDEGLEILPQLRDRGVAVPGLARHRLLADRNELRGDALGDALDPRGRTVLDHAPDRIVVESRAGRDVGHLAREQLVEHRAQRVDVGRAHPSLRPSRVACSGDM